MRTAPQLFVAQLPQLLPADWLSGEVNEPNLAVVIDTLRFTSTACVALQAGAASVYVAAEVEAARRLAGSLGSGTLLCGERHCHRIEGFQLGNSPFEYTPTVVAKHDLVFSTTNGTRAVAAAHGAQEVLLASLLNRAAIAEWILASSYKRVWILCAGTDGQIAAEDVLTAGAILSSFQAQHQSSSVLGNDSAAIALQLFKSLSNQHPHDSKEAITELLTNAAGGRNLIQSGYSGDIASVAHIDSIHIVPRASQKTPNRFDLSS